MLTESERVLTVRFGALNEKHTNLMIGKKYIGGNLFKSPVWLPNSEKDENDFFITSY